MHAFFAWAYAVMAGLLVVSFVAGTIAFWKAFDVKFSREEAAKKGAKVNWKLAYEQRITVFRLGLWLGLAAIALYYIDLNVHLSGHVWSFPWNTYSAIAIGWFLTVPLRQIWVMAVGIKTNHVLVANGVPEGLVYRGGFGVPPVEAEVEYFDHSLWATIQRYYRWGLRRGEFTDGKRMFKGRLRFVNKVSFLVKLAVGFQHWVWPVFAMMVFALIWPLTAFWLVFKHTADSRELSDSIEPWWRFPDNRPAPAWPDANTNRLSTTRASSPKSVGGTTHLVYFDGGPRNGTVERYMGEPGRGYLRLDSTPQEVYQLCLDESRQTTEGAAVVARYIGDQLPPKHDR
jgi:hypothetical protein